MPYRSVSAAPPLAPAPVDVKAAVGLYPLGSYGPADAPAAGCDGVGDEANVGSELDGSELVADFAEAFGVDPILSASAFAGELGYVACGVLPAAAVDVTGIDMLGGSAGVAPVVAPAAGGFVPATLADDGGAAGVRPAIATGCGVDWADGNTGSAERATADESGGVSCFQNAHRGPDWQPASTTSAAIVINLRAAV